jgi:hypothetical protein
LKPQLEVNYALVKRVPGESTTRYRSQDLQGWGIAPKHETF